MIMSALELAIALAPLAALLWRATRRPHTHQTLTDRSHTPVRS